MTFFIMVFRTTNTASKKKKRQHMYLFNIRVIIYLKFNLQHLYFYIVNIFTFAR